MVNFRFVTNTSVFKPLGLTQKMPSKKNFINSKVKIILMWSTWNPLWADKPLTNNNCPVTSCIFTTDASLIRQSDVVVFYIDTMEDFPLFRSPYQRFVFFNLESPMNSNLPILNRHHLRYGYFNWTMTYRWDSDIVHRDHYGYIGAKQNDNTIAARSLNNDWSNKIDHDFTSKKISDNTTTHAINSMDFIKNKTKLVAWFVGHCSTPIRREDYVKKLSHYIAVDVFGKCSNRTCPINCDEMLRSDYKFYLSFENSWCPDYVSEKFYRPMLFDTVPVVLGGADYNRFAPPYSYINAKDFNSPKELANYLLMLDREDKLYAEYFKWKRHYQVTMPDMYGLCDLCRMANDDKLPPKIYHDIKKWWLMDGEGCKNDSTKYF